MKTLHPEALERLRQALGPNGRLEPPDDLGGYLVDFRRLYRGVCSFVALPSSVDEVAACVRICAEHGIGIVPQGGNTGYCGAATPDESGTQIIVNLRRMNRIRRVDPGAYTITVDAGCTLAQVQQAAETVRRLFPLSLGSEGSCQIGGNVSTNAGGTAVLRYGTMRELVLGLEAVLPDGSVLDQLTALRKDNTGYDVKQLLIGAEGTLGIVTGATLKLFPAPAAHATALAAVADPTAALAVLGGLRAAFGDRVTTFEIMPRIALELAVKHLPGVTDPLGAAQPWYVLAELSAAAVDSSLAERFAEHLHAAIESGAVLDAVIASSESQRLALWYLREHIPEAQTKEGASLKHDISLPLATIPEFIRTAGAALAALAPGSRLIAYGHLGDGNLHFNLSPPPGGSNEEFLAFGERVKRTVHDLVAARRGSISAEHGIGRLKAGELRRYEDPVAFALMRTIKRALDPRGIMNPGKVLELESGAAGGAAR